MVRKGQKIPWIQSLDLGCAHVSCLQYNVTLGMTQFGHMDQDQSVQVLCWDHEFLWDTTEIWPQGQERGIWRAVPSQHLAEIVEDCECHERLLALTTGCWPSPLAADPWWRPRAGAWSPLVWYRGEVCLSHSSSCFSCRADCCYLALVNSWLCNIQIMQPAAL